MQCIGTPAAATKPATTKCSATATKSATERHRPLSSTLWLATWQGTENNANQATDQHTRCDNPPNHTSKYVVATIRDECV